MQSAKGLISEKEQTVFWVERHTGQIMLAPDTKLQPFRGWERVACATVAETESMSRRLAKQEFEKFRSLKVEEHIRYKQHRDRLRANCELRLAKGCISAADEYATRMTIRNLDAKDNALYRLLADEPDLSRASLNIEKYESGTIKAMTQKRRGLADDEINPANALIEGVR
jgi:hypothetical protein